MTKPDDKQAWDTKRRILDATLEALRTEGFAGATSRAIARLGGVNQALIFYHFGSLDAALLAALDASSGTRLQRYRSALEQANSISQLLRLSAEIYREDRESGHTAIVAQMVAGSLARPELAPQLVKRMQPWITFCEDAIRKTLGHSAVGEIVPVRDLAYALVTFYLGINLVTHLDRGGQQTEALFERVVALAPVLEQLLGQATDSSGAESRMS
jgi:AcrR family transcriptional regulator